MYNTTTTTHLQYACAVCHKTFHHLKTLGSHVRNNHDELSGELMHAAGFERCGAEGCGKLYCLLSKPGTGLSTSSFYSHMQ